MTSLRARRHQKQRERLADSVARSVLAEWSKVRPEAVARDWGELLPRVTAMVQAGQLHSAQGTHTFMRELLGPDAEDAPEIVSEQFASQTPDGRNLMGLLAQAIPTAIRALRSGRSSAEAHATGGAFLDLATRTVVADTGRQADQVSMVANRKVRAYVRTLQLPSCARCIILAGREYGTSTGFLRHPRCDCTMEPVTRKHTPVVPDPEDIVAAMSPAERRKAFGEAGAQAIEDGARTSSVVNARKGMTKIEMHGREVQATYQGTGRRKNKKPPRLMPEAIYEIAESREEAIRLLYRNGYLR
ncbi:hypothetical protein ACFPA8_08000 [Streptomyces ovatisporus]|uniref:Phage protein n=1 Tax=Streptomyces ovatisporus TaxID=1128682 RepID=A0ABV9A3B3_9ACTN